ncbi:MAG: hypothetical protein KBA82_00660 [Nitrosomonas sp.]|jgi:hypothetical protein|nr:hypothetical protein [Nitrosomonas sp.]MBP6365765.1 hypothetical protein [Nitrosomonas sp.]MBP7111508.1 hypothetical protein [Nitrosomonas sp.]
MIMKELSVGNADVINPIDVDIDDEGVLADGMIPDSRIVKLIDELEFASDDFDNDGDFENTLEFLGLR